jgi:hypothetical protein
MFNNWYVIYSIRHKELFQKTFRYYFLTERTKWILHCLTRPYAIIFFYITFQKCDNFLQIFAPMIILKAFGKVRRFSSWTTLLANNLQFWKYIGFFSLLLQAILLFTYFFQLDNFFKLAKRPNHKIHRMRFSWEAF